MIQESGDFYNLILYLSIFIILEKYQKYFMKMLKFILKLLFPITIIFFNINIIHRNKKISIIKEVAYIYTF